MMTKRWLSLVVGVVAALAGPAWGDLFVSGLGAGTPRVARYDQSSGAFLGYYQSGELPAGIGVGPDQRLYSSGDVLGAGILYRASGSSQVTLVEPTFVNGSLTPDHGWTFPQDAGFGADGAMYVTSNFNSSYGSSSTTGILRYATDGTYLGKFADTPGRYITFGPGGDLFVNTGVSAAGDIKRYRASDGALLGTFVSLGSGGLTSPMGITFGPDGNFYVADRMDNRVLRYDGTTGAPLGVFVASGAGGLQGLFDIAFGPDGNLYAGSSNAVLRYNGTSGEFIDAFVPATLPPNGGQIAPWYITFGDVPEPAGAAILAVSIVWRLASRRCRRAATGC